MQNQTKHKTRIKSLWKSFIVLLISFFVSTAAFQIPVYAADANVQVQQQEETILTEQKEGEEGTSFLVIFMTAIIFLVIVVVIVVASSVSALGAVVSKQLEE